jgi:hypothetical protein
VEHTLRVYENRVLRSIFLRKRNEVTAGYRKLHNEELHDFYSSPSIIRMIKLRRVRWAGRIPQIWEKRNTCSLLLEKPGGKEATRKTNT